MILLQIKIMYIFRVLRLMTKDLNDPDESTFYNVYGLKDKSNFT
jgi:hypothetical protein